MARIFDGSTETLSGTGGTYIGTGGIFGAAAWVRVDAIGSGNFGIHEIISNASVTNVQFLLSYSSGSLYVKLLWNSLTGNDSVITGSVAIPADGNWRFIAGSLQYANGSAAHQIWYGDATTAVYPDPSPTRVTSGNTAPAGITSPYTHKISNPGGNTIAVAHVHHLNGASGQPGAAIMERIRQRTLLGTAPTVRQAAVWPLNEDDGTAAAADAGSLWAIRLTSANMSANQISAAPWVDPQADLDVWRTQATAPTVTGGSDLASGATVAADGYKIPTGTADLTAAASMVMVPNADLHVSHTFAGTAEVRAGMLPDIECLDISNMSLDYVRTSTVNTWWPQNGELNGGQMAGNGSYSMVVDTSTMESGSAAIGWQLDNSQFVSHNPYLNRFRHYLRSPSGATGNAMDGASDTRTKTGFAKVHGKHRMRVSVLGDTWDHFYTDTPIVVFEDSSRTAVAQLWVKARGEGHAFYLAPGAAVYTDIANHPEWLAGHMSYDSSMAGKWFDIEWAIDTDPASSVVPSGHDVRAAMRIVTPARVPSRWLHLSWTAATWSGSNGDVVSWLYGQNQARDSAVSTVYNNFKLDHWWMVTGDRWWFHRDFHGWGGDGWGPQTKITYLPIGTTTLLNESSAWTVNAMDAVPASHIITPSSTTTLNKKLVVDVTDLAVTPGTILGVAAKAVADHNSGTATNGNGLELALCDTSNNFTKTQAVNVRGATQCQQAYHLASATNLSGGAWTASDINALRFGFRSSAATTSNSWRIFGAGVYVAYNPAQTSTTSLVGQPTAAPTAQLPQQNSGQGSNDPRGDYSNPANSLRTHNWWEWWPALTTDTSGNNNTAFPVFVDYNPANDKYYASFWGASPFGGHSNNASSTNICAGIVEWDPFTGDKKLIWRADETAASEDGGPHVNISGTYGWRLSGLTASEVHGPGNRFNLHAIRVDKRPYLDDGTTPNPFYGHLFATFCALNSTQNECKTNQMVLWLNPSRKATQNADGTARSTVRASSDYCWARRIDYPATGTAENAGNGSPGGYWCCPTERYIFATRIATAYTLGAVSGGQILWLDKKPFTTGSADGLHGQRWSGGTAGVGYPQWKSGESNFDNYWAIKNVGGAVTTGYVNQQYYAGGYLWTTALQIRRTDPKAADIGASLKEIQLLRGSGVVAANTRYVTANPSTQKLWVSAWLGASSRNPTTTDCNVVLELDPNNGSGNPEILRWFRVPTELSKSAAESTGGGMGAVHDIHGLQCIDDDTILVNILEEVDPNSNADYFPYCAIWILRPSRNEWIELPRPAKNAALVPMLPFMCEDGGIYERPSPPGSGEPPNRRKSWEDWKSSGTPLPDAWRQWLGADLGWQMLNSDGDPWTYRTGGGTDIVDHRTNGFIVRWWAPEKVQAADETLVTITVDLSGVTGSPTQIDEWVCELGGDGTLGGGGAIDGGTNVAADADGTVTLVGHVRGSDYKPGTRTAACDFYWRIGSNWSARRTS